MSHISGIPQIPRALKFLLILGLSAGSITKSHASGPPPDAGPDPNHFFEADIPISRHRIVFFPVFHSLPQPIKRILDSSVIVTGDTLNSGQNLYESLSPKQRAALLNIFSKMASAQLPDGSSVLDHVIKIKTSETDRIFVETDDHLFDLVKTSPHFLKRLDFVTEFFHPRHGGAGCAKQVIGFKDDSDEGGLELDFGMDEARKKTRVESDIDLHTEHVLHVKNIFSMEFLRHWGEVLHNHLLDQKTNPYQVYRIETHHHQPTLYEILPRKAVPPYLLAENILGGAGK